MATSRKRDATKRVPVVNNGFYLKAIKWINSTDLLFHSVTSQAMSGSINPKMFCLISSWRIYFLLPWFHTLVMLFPEQDDGEKYNILWYNMEVNQSNTPQKCKTAFKKYIFINTYVKPIPIKEKLTCCNLLLRFWGAQFFHFWGWTFKIMIVSLVFRRWSTETAFRSSVNCVGKNVLLFQVIILSGRSHFREW